MKKLAVCIALLVILSGCVQHQPVEHAEKYCVGGLPPVALKNKNFQGELSLLVQQIFGGSVDVRYESRFTKILDDEALREWVVAETECRVARDSSDNADQKRWFLTMRQVARTAPRELIPWLRENPMPNLSGNTELIEVEGGHCGEWNYVFSIDENGQTETRRVGKWIPSGKMIKIPVAMYRDYMEYMRCEEKPERSR